MKQIQDLEKQCMDLKHANEASLKVLKEKHTETLNLKDEKIDDLELERDQFINDKQNLMDELERLRNEIEDLREKPAEIIRDDQEIEKVQKDLVNALENIRRCRELTETKEKEIEALK